MLPFLLDDGETEGLIGSYHSHQFQPHYHHTWAIGVALAGRHRLWCEGRCWEVRPGDVVIVPPGALHTGALVRGAWSIAMVFPRSGGAVATRFPSAAVLRGSPMAARLARAIRQAALERGRDRLEVLELAARVSSSGRNRFEGWSPRADHRVLAARERLDAWDRISFDVPSLASEIGLHPTYLAQQFRRAYGIGPYAYWVAGRVELARERLRRGARPGELAHALGFADQSHFSRTFRRAVGIPPGVYRGRLTQPIDPKAADSILKMF